MKKIIISDFFNDKSIQKKFQKNGIVEAFKISQIDVNKLLAIYNKYHSNLEDEYLHKFHVGIHSADEEYKKNLHESIKLVLDPYYQNIFKNYRRLTYTVIIKGTGYNSILPLHQDWSLVNESMNSSATVWLTLCDSNIENGAIFAIPGSHKFINTPRAGSISGRVEHLHEKLLHLMKPYPCKAGTILVFDPRLFHYSPSNHTKEPRITVINSIVPESAILTLYYQEKNEPLNPLELYEVPDDFHLRFNNFVEEQHDFKPQGKKIGELRSLRLEKVRLKDFLWWYKKERIKLKIENFFNFKKRG